jgi:ABC-2 type transport system permease protein
MTADISLGVPLTRRVVVASKAELAITRRAFRQVRLSAVAWGVVFGATVASSALTYVNSFPDAASRHQLAATTGRDAGVSILLGPISSIDTVGGYTVYKAFVTLTTIGAIWALLAATRLLRGEEDAGRWQLTLAGGTRASRATLATLVGLGAAGTVIVALTTLFTALAGRKPTVGFSVGDSIVYGLSIAIAPAVFLAVGAFTSQLGRSRRVANQLGMAVFGVAFVIRMIADSGHSTKWLLWLTPFGWTERMRPITENNLAPLLLAVVSVAVLVAASATLASNRDVGAGLLADRDVVAIRPFGLGSTFGFDLRMDFPAFVAWFGGVAAAGLSLGIVSKVVSGAAPKSVSDLLHKFDLQGAFVRQYFGIAFLMLAAIVCLLPVSPISASAEDEMTGRLVNVLALPTRRASLLAARLVTGAAAVLIAGMLGGAFIWVGARLQGVDPGFGTVMRAGLNVVPTALLVLGIGAVVRTVAPRFATAAIYGVVVWSFVIDLFASLVHGTRWLDHLSLFHYMALAPAQPTDATTIVLTLGLAAALLAGAALLFTRRDVQTG